MNWQHIDDAPKDGSEILGVRYYNRAMSKEPFLTFWSPTLNRFYLSPTHWIPIPELPCDERAGEGK
jgi:hypothetical protein